MDHNQRRQHSPRHHWDDVARVLPEGPEPGHGEQAADQRPVEPHPLGIQGQQVSQANCAH